MTYNSMNPATWQAPEGRQVRPTLDTARKRVAEISPGDAFFDSLPGVWRGVVMVETTQNPGMRRLHCEDGGSVQLPIDWSVSVDNTGSIGWSAPEVSRVWKMPDLYLVGPEVAAKRDFDTSFSKFLDDIYAHVKAHATGTERPSMATRAKRRYIAVLGNWLLPQGSWCETWFFVDKATGDVLAPHPSMDRPKPGAVGSIYAAGFDGYGVSFDGPGIDFPPLGLAVIAVAATKKDK